MFDFFDSSQRELDLWLLTALIFLPAAFAVGLFAIPAKFREAQRWWATLGTALTVGLGLCVLVDYYNRVLDFPSDRSTRTLYTNSSRLDVRADLQQAEANAETPGKAYQSHDLIVRRSWIERFDAFYYLGVDGINLLLVLLTAVVMLLAVVASWQITDRLRGYLALLLLLETGVIGAFLSLDFFLFYVFYEVMLIPMYFLVGLWGGGRRKYAAIKFVVYTLVGGIGLLAAIIALHATDVRDFVDQNVVKARASEISREQPWLPFKQCMQLAEIHSFDIVTLSKVGRAVMLVLNGEEDRIGVRKSPGDLPGPDETGNEVRLLAPGVDKADALTRLKSQAVCTKTFQYVVFALMFLGFAVKVPIFPLHSWLPDAHVEAPTPVSMVLAGVLLKLGGYGMLRMAWPICPWAAHELATVLGLIGVIGIVYGAFVAMGQTDFKKLLAYSSVSHMGYVVLGLAAWGSGPDARTWYEWAAAGAVFQMLAHGVSASALFFAVGVVYDRAHHRDVNRLGGLTEPMPAYTGLAAVLFFASMGLPGLCGFVGELFVMVGAWHFSPALAVPAILCTILTAAYLLWTWQRVYLGVNEATKSFPDISAREALILGLFAFFAIVLGILPGIVIFQWVDPAVAAWADDLSRLK